MKKRILALALCMLMVFAFVAACGGDEADDMFFGDPSKPTINLWSFTDEIPNSVRTYVEENPDFPNSVRVTIIPTTEGAYQPALDAALSAGGSDMPHMYTAEAAFVLKYTQGEASGFASSYAGLGIDINNQLSAAGIAPYISDVGTRTSDGAVVALGWQNTGSALIYRASIAEEVFGTSDPAEVANIVGPGWDKFLEAAAELEAAGYATVAGEGDIWQMARNAAGTQSYIDADGYLYLDPNREQYLDLAKALVDGNFSNREGAWGDGWFAGMGGEGARPVFCYMGPAWLINYVMINNVGDTFGDWRVTSLPVPSSWGGTWILANKDLPDDVRDGVRELVEWITLDTTDGGFLYRFGNNLLGTGAKDAVSSSVVMARSDGTLDILGGQDMFDYFIPAGALATADFFSPYDETISQRFNDQVVQYIEGEKTREEAIADWRAIIADELGIPSR